MNEQTTASARTDSTGDPGSPTPARAQPRRLAIRFRASGALAIALVGSVLGAGCRAGERKASLSGGDEAVRPVAAEASSRAPAGSADPVAPSNRGTTPTVATEMSWHSEATQRLIDAAVAGDFSTVRVRARALAEDEWSPALKPAWRTHHDAVRDAARRLERAPDGVAVAEALAEVGVACAGCHQAESAALAPPASKPPAGEVMPRHRWATDQLWLGLSLPSEVAWEQGAGIFAAAPAVRSDSEPVDQWAKRLSELGQSARTAPARERPAIFARVLSTCARCHDELAPRSGSSVRE